MSDQFALESDFSLDPNTDKLFAIGLLHRLSHLLRLEVCLIHLSAGVVVNNGIDDKDLRSNTHRGRLATRVLCNEVRIV